MIERDCDRRGCHQRWGMIYPLVVGSSILDIGCAHGDGCRYVAPGVQYEGVDDNNEHLNFPETCWPVFANPYTVFTVTDFRSFIEAQNRQWDTIVAMEVLEHLSDGKEWAQKLTKYCKRLIISVPENRDGPGEENNHHVLRKLMPADFPGFTKIGSNGYSMFLVWQKG